MSSKLFGILLLAVAVSAVEYQQAPAYHTQVYHQSAPVYHQQPAYVKSYAPVVKQVEYEEPAKYDFAYQVHDDHTGDVKTQQESRDGDAVHGSYSLIDSDGYKRIVEYTADKHSGFNAVVRREPLGHQKAIAAPKVYAAPSQAYHHY